MYVVWEWTFSTCTMVIKFDHTVLYSATLIKLRPGKNILCIYAQTEVKCLNNWSVHIMEIGSSDNKRLHCIELMSP